MKSVGMTLCIAIVALLSGCEKMRNKPVDMHDSPLVGSWFGERQLEQASRQIWDRLFIRIGANGELDYHYLSCERGDNNYKSEKNLDLQDMPVIRLKKDKMVIQTYPLTPKFELTLGAWPNQDDGVLQVDGLPLKPVSGDAVPGWNNWHCDWPSAH